ATRLLAVDALPPTDDECASDAAPQLSEVAPQRDAAASLRRKRTRDDASDSTFLPRRRRFSRPLDREPGTVPPAPLPRDIRRALRASADTAAQEASQAAPLVSIDALPAAPAQHASEAVPQPSEAAPALTVDALPPTDGECASEAVPQPSEAAPALTVDALPPTDGECASEAVPQPSEAAPALTVDALPPTDGECASEAVPQPSEAAPALRVEAARCMCRKRLRDFSSEWMLAKRRRCTSRRLECPLPPVRAVTSRRCTRRGGGPCKPAAASRSSLRGRWRAVVRTVRRWCQKALGFGHRLIYRRSRASAGEAAPQSSQAVTLPCKNASPSDVAPAPLAVLHPRRAPLPPSAHCMTDSQLETACCAGSYDAARSGLAPEGRGTSE
ncbi:uncharacterized protein, partial [Leishmania mexicana MHOM/GT/2001/U1103]